MSIHQRYNVAGALAALAIMAGIMSCAREVPMKPVRQAILFGTIRDGGGNPVSDVTVSLEIHSGPYVTSSGALDAETDSSGNYQLALPEGEYFPILLSLDDRVPFTRLGAIEVRPPTTRFDYQFGGHRVSGVVTVPGGGQLDSGLVVVEAVTADYQYQRIPILGGTYAVYVPTGTYSFWFSSRHATYEFGQNFMPVSIEADTTWNVSLDGHAIAGSVTIGGAALSGATVQANGNRAYARTQTDATGSYTFNLPSGDYDWSAYKSPISNVYPWTQSGPGISGPAIMNFDLSGIRWSGTVRMSPSNDPVAGAEVYLDQGYVYPTVASTTDASGQFDLILRPGRRYRLSVIGSGAASQEIFGILAGNDSTFDIVLSPPSP